MAPGMRDIQLSVVGGRRPITAREDDGDLEDVRLLDSYDEEAAAPPEGTGREASEKGVRRIQVRVTGMTCSACTSAVEGAISALPGVTRASVSLLQNKAHVVFDPSLLKVEIRFPMLPCLVLCCCFFLKTVKTFVALAVSYTTNWWLISAIEDVLYCSSL